MTQFVDADGRNYVPVSFGSNEAAAMSFVERYWDRVGGMSYFNPKENLVNAGWIVNLYPEPTIEDDQPVTKITPVKPRTRNR